ncbi:MAG: flippase-like domain-containing protein [Endomicrobiales bacterium]|nr:flippase-like domain-containing protein [Endomicrobiales bacterium]
MKKLKVKVMLLVLKAAFICAIFSWIFFKVDVSLLDDIFRQAKYHFGSLSILAGFAAILIISGRTMILGREIWPGNAIGLIRYYSINLLSIFYMLFFPTTVAGDAVRIFKIGRQKSRDYINAGVIVTTDRVVGVVTWFLLYMTLPAPFKSQKMWLVLVVILFAGYMLRRKIKIWKEIVLDFSKYSLRGVLKAVFFSIFSQTSFIISGYFMFRCFGLDLDVLEVGGLVSLGALTGLIPISVLGVSIREGFYIAILPKYGASDPQAFLITACIVAVNYVLGIAGGLWELAETGWSLAKFKEEAKEIETIK